MGNMERPVNSMNIGSLPHFICYEMSSLVKSDTMWNTKCLDKVFIQFINGSFSRSIASRQAVKANPYPIDVIERRKCSKSKGHGHLGYFLL